MLAASLFAFASPLGAQEAPGPASEPAPDAGAAESVTAGGGRSYEPAYFAQYSPRTALEMVERIPGFRVQEGNTAARGLGEASTNVIINGRRVSTKSDDIRSQLTRIPADNVVRIEVVDGTTLDIPGLSGQVVNVITDASTVSGQFEWRTGFRAHNTQAQMYGGEASLSGRSGELDYTVAISNNNDRFGADGPILVRDGAGAIIERQYSKFSGRFDNPKLAAKLSYPLGEDSAANLNLSYGVDYFLREEPEIGTPAAGPVRLRASNTDEIGPEYEIGGDIDFRFGPGKLKLIGLERFERNNLAVTVVDAFSDDSPATGFEFVRTDGIGERIGRFEYGWRLLEADWQLSGEAAFNRLDRASGLFELSPGGQFVAIPFPQGTGGVREDRYESILSFSKQLTGKLGLQASGGAEYSKIEQTGTAANSRRFLRPKGSLSLAWKPAGDLDATITLRRRVGQLSFGDFLASVSLNDNNENGGNNSLVPDQSWNLELELNKRLGPWGSVKFEARQAWFEDFVDFFPLPGGGEARGNIGDARRLHLELNATVKMDPIGWRGAQFEVQGIKRWMRVTDPFTNLVRPFSYDLNDRLEIDFRHDIPDSDWAYGGGLSTQGNAPYSRRFEVGRESEGPVFLNAFAEHKDVLGLTVNATVANLLGARNNFERTVFASSRPNAPVLFSEIADRRIGPIFRFTVSGNF